MKRSRREFIGTGAALAAMSAARLPAADAQAVRGEGHRWDETCAWMKLSLAYFYAGGVRGRPERVSMARQMGVLGGVGGGGRDVAETKRAYEEMGLEWTVLEGVNLTRAQLGVAGQDEDIERFIALIRSCAAVGQRIICYNWMPAVNWARSDTARVDRGGSLVTAFDIEQARTDLTDYGDRFTHDDLWKNMEHFLKAVVPEAEKHDVRLALHPDDPPVERLRGIPRIITSIDALKRVTRIYPSPYNGLTFCQGSIASQGPDVDIPAAIRWFGERGLIHFVHFRDVRGTPTNFVEAWHDDGQNDMYAAMKAYYDVGFRGPIRPDHVPTVTAFEENTFPGYNDLGALFAIGYIKGLMEAAMKASAS
jgi:mannonate dehydratase